MERTGTNRHIQRLDDCAAPLGPELLQAEYDLLEIHANYPWFKRQIIPEGSCASLHHKSAQNQTLFEICSL